MADSQSLFHQAASEVSRITSLAQKDIEIDPLQNRRILLIDSQNTPNLTQMLKKNPYFCDINFTHYYGNNEFLITATSIYGKRIFYKVLGLQNSQGVQKYTEICSLIRDNYKSFDGFVVFHDFETICYTASFLSFMMEDLGKTVVLTGSQLPMNVLKTDATTNLLNALNFTGHFTIPEVLICFRDKLFRGNRSQICDSLGFDCVCSPNFPILGTFSMRIELKKDLFLKKEAKNEENLTIFNDISSDVVVIKLNPFMTSELLTNQLNTKNLKGVVLETYGFGQITMKNEGFMTIFQEFITKKDLIVLNISQSFSYNLEKSQYNTHYERQFGLINGGDMTLETSLAKLSYLLGKGLPKEEIISKLRQNLKGEISVKSEDEVFSYKESALLQAIANPLENQSLYAESIEKVILPSIIAHVCSAGYLSLLKQLASSVNLAQKQHGKNPLHYAAAQESQELVGFLVASGCDVNQEDKEGKTPLYEAIRLRNKAIVSTLVSAGGVIKAPRQAITSLLLNGAQNNDLELIKLIFHSGLTDLNSYRNVEGRNIGHIAASQGHLLIINYLWKVANFDFSERDDMGRTPLDDARYFKHEEIIAILDPLAEKRY